MKINKVRLGKANCALDIGDGSERGEYVCQDYMLNTLGRPHRMVNIMYTYYPKDKQWPSRISEACKDMEVKFQWDYPYDDYFPYGPEGKQFEQMRDIRMHGQDVLLTLTIDCSLDDDELRKVAKTLRSYGRICIRINHECNGDWFTHNKRFSFQEIGDFFVRFDRIIKEEAPNVRTIFCAGRVDTSAEYKESGKAQFDPVTNEQKIVNEDEFRGAYEAADIISADRYLCLHYGWPYDIAEADDPNGQYCAYCVEDVYNEYVVTAKRLRNIVGNKPFIQAEFNSDGDVTGPMNQSESVLRYYGLVKNDDENFIDGISMYQFRDRGRLGLEIEDPNNSSIGIKQPLMDAYKTVLFDPYFYPSITEGEEIIDTPVENIIPAPAFANKEADSDAKNAPQFKTVLRWGGSEDAEGIGMDLELSDMPVFCEVTLQKNLAMMIECNGRWFYKAPGVATIDLMSAFFENVFSGPKVCKVRMFATPADGENHDDGREDWATNCYMEMNELPKFRIRYKVPGIVK